MTVKYVGMYAIIPDVGGRTRMFGLGCCRTVVVASWGRNTVVAAMGSALLDALSVTLAFSF